MNERLDDVPGGPVDAGVVVTGNGTAAEAPDLASVRLAAFAVRPGLAEALAAADASARRMREALNALGVARRDATTSGFSVHPEQSWSEAGGNRITGYRAEHTMTVSVRDLQILGRLVGEVLAAGGDDAVLHEIGFAVQDPARVRALARDAAWQDARATAEQLASLSGGRLGAVRSVTEDASGGPAPMPRAMAARAEVAMEPGDVTVSVRLTVRWDLS